MSGARRVATALIVPACWLWAVAPAVGAQTETRASIRPSLLPDRLGASTALTLAFQFSGGTEGVPAPLHGIVAHLPTGLTVNLRNAAVCTKSNLQRHGAAGCSSKSLIGRGHAVMEVHAGSQLLPEEVAISVFRGPNRGGRQTLEILSQGETPLDERTVSAGTLERDRAPYGSKLTMSFPAIPTLMLEPDASFASLSLTIGGVGHRPRAHAAAGAIFVPRSCPAGGFPFAADFTFADGSTASAAATVACP